MEIGGELPASFPTPANAETAAEDVRQQLSAAGFEEAMWNDTESMITGIMGNDVYLVTISIMLDGDEANVKYGVIELE